MTDRQCGHVPSIAFASEQAHACGLADHMAIDRIWMTASSRWQVRTQVKQTAGPGDNPRSEADDQLNEQFHALLRDAADKREGRTRVHSSEDADAARKESADLLALARGAKPAATER